MLLNTVQLCSSYDKASGIKLHPLSPKPIAHTTCAIGRMKAGWDKGRKGGGREGQRREGERKEEDRRKWCCIVHIFNTPHRT